MSDNIPAPSLKNQAGFYFLVSLISFVFSVYSIYFLHELAAIFSSMLIFSLSWPLAVLTGLGYVLTDRISAGLPGIGRGSSLDMDENPEELMNEMLDDMMSPVEEENKQVSDNGK